MASIPYSERLKGISEAAACPHCGSPLIQLRKVSSGRETSLVELALMLILGAASICYVLNQQLFASMALLPAFAQRPSGVPSSSPATKVESTSRGYPSLAVGLLGDSQQEYWLDAQPKDKDKIAYSQGWLPATENGIVLGQNNDQDREGGIP